jgi:Plant ATP synthase F0
MAQFDALIIFPLIWSLLLTLGLHYTFVLRSIVPNFLGVVKFRAKKFGLASSSLNAFNSATKVKDSYKSLF